MEASPKRLEEEGDSDQRRQTGPPEYRVDGLFFARANLRPPFRTGKIWSCVFVPWWRGGPDTWEARIEGAVTNVGAIWEMMERGGCSKFMPREIKS